MPPRVHFSMRLVEAADGTVAGEVRENPPLGFPEVGVVEGRAQLMSVALRKTMPVLRLLDGDHLITLTEWVQRKYPNVLEVNTLPHPTIHLTARLFRWPGFMAGVWWVPNGTIADENSSWRADYPASSGVWQAKRARDAA